MNHRKSASSRGAIIIIFSLFLVLGVMPGAQAQALAQKPDLKTGATQTDKSEIIVYGTRLPMRLSEAGTSVHVITADELQEKGNVFVLDALGDVAGVNVNQNGAFGGAGFARLRGATNNGQTLVLIDGVVVNDPTSPSNAFNFAYLDSSQIDVIEILKGGQATLWGSDAMAGVVSITTKRPEERLIESFIEFGSFETLRAGASLAGAIGRVDGRFSVTYHETNGISKADAADGNSERDGLHSLTISAGTGLDVTDDLRLSGNLLFTSSKTDFDAFGPVDGEAIAENDQLVLSVRALYTASENQQHDVQLGLSSIARDNYGADAYAFGEDGERTSFRYQNTMTYSARLRSAAGVEYEHIKQEDKAASQRYDTADITSLFGLLEWKPVEKLTLSFGGRYDDHSIFGDEITGRAALAYVLSGATRLQASLSQGRKAPTLSELSDTQNLKPEEARSFDVAIMHEVRDNFSVQLTYFEQQTDQLIQYVYSNCQGLWPNSYNCYVNIAEADVTGFELAADLDLSMDLSLSVTYSLIDGETGSGETLGRIPEHEANITLSYQPETAFSGNLIVRYNDEELDRNGSSVKLADWWRVDMNMAYDIGMDKQFYARIENLFDESYQQVLGYGTPGLSVYAGFRLKI